MASDAKPKSGAAQKSARTLRSRAWFDNPDNPGMTALYLERQMNFGLTLDELHRSNRPVIGIAQTGSDLSPCNRHHLELAARVRDGIRQAGFWTVAIGPSNTALYYPLSSRSTRSRRPASAPPPDSTATSPISASSSASTATTWTVSS